MTGLHARARAAAAGVVRVYAVPRSLVRTGTGQLHAPPPGFYPCVLAAGLLLSGVVLGPLADAGPLARALPLLTYAVLVVAARAALARGFPHPTYGACNAVTHLRATGVAGLTAVLFVSAPPMDGWLVPVVAGLILALDGVDGWLARRAGRCSDFGARFDMETDAALALLLAVLVWQGGIAGVWVLWLGLARYGFMAAGWVRRWLRAPLAPCLRRKVGCVVQVGALVLALVPGVPAVAAQGALIAAALVLAWSFGADVIALARARHAPEAPGQARSGTERRAVGRAA